MEVSLDDLVVRKETDAKTEYHWRFWSVRDL